MSGTGEMMDPKTILITGVSSGIGLATARILHDSTHRVVATCREKSLAKIPADLPAHERFVIVPLDVCCASSRRSALEEARNRFGDVDVLINNAGISFRSSIEDLGDEDDLLQLETNYLGPMALIRQVLPGMRAKRQGLIINVSSVGGMMAMPLMGAYSASKFALEGASEALWYELRPWGISVVLLQPGFINSDAFRKVMKGKAVREHGEHASAYHRVYSEMSHFIERWMLRAWATPESIAKKIVSLIDASDVPLRVPATPDAHLFGTLRRILPRRIYHYFLYRMLPGVDRWSEP